ncbi:hypothetical protein PPSIR1_33656 [Plesiocystis pacifica SIR-1]|uniref:DUF493 domain-containing protein n=1 Tax=Plesiocystis pacifica SIR-1 TaxID=391625 RepID=A6GKK2_9BACT|nr:DUF493 domain-containing protein [Plesiocystis pacifica]EDM73601.1 hypothetical protein PPSIR1_33656 [Plesiocystis pacifica SIR-1]
MAQSTRRAPERELIESQHEFPGEYLIKAFGPASATFREGAVAAARGAVGDRVSVSERLSSKGNSVCVTLVLQAQTVDEVIATYERLHELSELKLIL